jgi:peptidoglycan/xylan/chitin deacetylase (PgdA/CDA1 family)
MWLLAALAGCRRDEEPTTDTVDTDLPTHPADTDEPDDTDEPVDPNGPERRYDCSGMDPADPAPLGGWIALTFDDGPDPLDTPVILEVLRAYDVPATFMMLGEQVSNPEVWPLVEEIVADPLFEVGNHSWSHTDLADASLATVEAEMDETADLLETFGVPRDHFRFPYGDSTCTTHDMATDRGYRVTGWHIDTADWCYASGDGICLNEDYWRVPVAYEADMIGLSMEQIRRFDGGIVLFHDIHTWTAEQLGPFIEAALAEGFRFTTITDTEVFPNLVAGTPADLPYLGERCDTTDDLCWQVEHDAWCEPVAPGDPDNTDGICTLPCEGLCLDRAGAAVTFCAETAGTGQCVGQSASQNGFCADLPGTDETDLPRFVGTSGVSDGTATVCAPAHW